MPRVPRQQRHAAFDDFAAGSIKSLLRTAYLVSGDAGHAEDLVQETLLKVARRWPRVVSMDNSLAYARKILVNLALDGSNRRTLHRAELAGPGDSEVPDAWQSKVSPEPFAAVEDKLEIIRTLGELTPRQRATLVLRYLDNMSESQVASTLGCSVGTVKSTTARALEKMRELIQKQDRRPGPPRDSVPVQSER